MQRAVNRENARYATSRYDSPRACLIFARFIIPSSMAPGATSRLTGRCTLCNVAGMENLSHYAKETGLSQRELAKRLGVDPSIVSRLMNGQMRPGLELAVRIQRLTDGRVVASSWVDNSETSEPDSRSEATNAR